MQRCVAPSYEPRNIAHNDRFDTDGLASEDLAHRRDGLSSNTSGIYIYIYFVCYFSPYWPGSRSRLRAVSSQEHVERASNRFAFVHESVSSDRSRRRFDRDGTDGCVCTRGRVASSSPHSKDTGPSAPDRTRTWCVSSGATRECNSLNTWSTCASRCPVGSRFFVSSSSTVSLPRNRSPSPLPSPPSRDSPDRLRF